MSEVCDTLKNTRIFTSSIMLVTWASPLIFFHQSSYNNKSLGTFRQQTQSLWVITKAYISLCDRQHNYLRWSIIFLLL
jgi:hypothetical protein